MEIAKDLIKMENISRENVSKDEEIKQYKSKSISF